MQEKNTEYSFTHASFMIYSITFKLEKINMKFWNLTAKQI